MLKGKESDNFLDINYEAAEEELMLAANRATQLNYSNLKDQLDEIDEKIARDRDLSQNSIEKEIAM